MILRNNADNSEYELRIKEEFKPSIVLGAKFMEMQAGNISVTDRGVTTDSYSCEVETYGTQEYIDGLIEHLQGIREGGFDCQIQDCSDGEHLFGENIDYTDEIPIVIEDISEAAHKTLGGIGFNMTLKVEVPTDLTFIGTAALPQLKCLDPKYKADSGWSYNIIESYTSNHYIYDSVYDFGAFEGTFVLKTSELKDLQEFRRINRYSIATLSSTGVLGLDNIFGVRAPAYPLKIRLMDVKTKYRAPGYYDVTVKIREHKDQGVI